MVGMMMMKRSIVEESNFYKKFIFLKTKKRKKYKNLMVNLN